jgi:4,5-DOPA dioxygenase extradiol
MFPNADIPVIAVSIQSHAGTAQALAMGQALEALTHQGFLVIGSGNITHNLGDLRMAHTCLRSNFCRLGRNSNDWQSCTKFD